MSHGIMTLLLVSPFPGIPIIFLFPKQSISGAIRLQLATQRLTALIISFTSRNFVVSVCTFAYSLSFNNLRSEFTTGLRHSKLPKLDEIRIAITSEIKTENNSQGQRVQSQQLLTFTVMHIPFPQPPWPHLITDDGLE